MSDAEKSLIDGEDWRNFCRSLERAGEQILRPEAPGDAFNRAEGFRYLSRLVRAGLEWYVEFNDPDFPVLYEPSHETIKIGADNPDNLYQKAVLNGALEYRITGSRGSVYYLSFTTSKGSYAGASSQQLETGFLDSNALTVNEDGSFEILISARSDAKKAASSAVQNVLAMEADTESLLIRQTFLDRTVEDAAMLKIERLNAPTVPPLNPVEFQANLAKASSFIENTATLFADWSASYKGAENELPPADQALCQSVGGDPNIFYYHGYWKIAADEALVIDVSSIPDCDYWNFQLDNYWMESLDYRYHTIHLNNHTAVKNPDGSVRVIVAHEDPGLPNWISTAGHGEGTHSWRWVRASTQVHPQSKLVKLADFKRELKKT